MNKYVAWIFAVVILLTACENESLRDTYKDFAGDGEIRYIGRCTDLLAQPGWLRVIVTWKNNVDPLVENVKVKWTLDSECDSVILPRGTEEYSIRSLNGKELPDGVYTISVTGVDVQGNCAIEETTTGRPYTYSHEEVLGFNRVISNHYVINGNLVLCLLNKAENLTSAKLYYTRGNDSRKDSLDLLQDDLGSYYLLEDKIKDGDDLILKRKGVLLGCQDTVVFLPDTLTYDVKLFSADFKQEMKRQYGLDEGDLTDEWAATVETLCLDWDITSFIDLLNFPNLKKLVLGSRRYLLPQAVDDEEYGQSVLTEVGASNFVLKVMNQLTGLEVERYNKHYNKLNSDFDFIYEKQGEGNSIYPREPDKEFIDLDGLKFSVTPEEDEAFPSGLENLTDGDDNTTWDPQMESMQTTYQLTLDLKEPRKLRGIRLVQKVYTRNNGREIIVAPAGIKIKVSDANGYAYQNATYLENNVLGKSQGEVNYIEFSKDVQDKEWRYIRLELDSKAFGKYYYTSLAEVSLY